MSLVLPFANYAAGYLNQSCQHIAHARIRRQAQGRTLGFHSAGCNIGCRSPLSNCNWCARIDLSSFYRPFDNPFSFMFRHRSGDVFLSVMGWSDISLAKTPQEVGNQQDHQDGAKSNTSTASITPPAVTVISPTAAQHQNQNNDQNQHAILRFRFTVSARLINQANGFVMRFLLTHSPRQPTLCL